MTGIMYLLSVVGLCLRRSLQRCVRLGVCYRSVTGEGRWKDTTLASLQKDRSAGDDSLAKL